MPSRRPARSRGPPRPTDSRASARDMSGAARSVVRMSSRAALSATKVAIASSRRAIAALSVSGAASRCASSRDPAGGHRAVDGIEQRAAPFARQRARQFEIGAGRRIDRHRGAGGFARRRRQRRALSDLGAVDIGDGGGRRGRFQPRHRGEAIHGGDREIIAQPPFGGGAVEDVAGQRRHRRQFAQQRPELGIAIERVGDDDFIRIDPRQRRRKLARSSIP